MDYLLYVDRAAAGAVEAKKEGWTLSGVEAQSRRYSEGLPDALPAYRRPLPFLYESTSVETRFTNLLDPEPRSREVFTFHRPETHREWLQQAGYEQSRRALPGVAESPAPYAEGDTLRARLKTLPPLMTDGLWPPQITAIDNLEHSLAQNKPRALIQMATGSGKTFTARPGSGPVYVIECPSCERQFRRTTRSTTLRAHKDACGDRCYGRRGILVDTL